MSHKKLIEINAFINFYKQCEKKKNIPENMKAKIYRTFILYRRP